MAHYDEDTLSFMQKVSGEDEGQTHGEKALMTLRHAVSMKSPVKAAVRLASDTLAEKAFHKIQEKQAGVTDPLIQYRMLNDKYGREWHDWEPETLWQSMKEEMGALTGPDERNIVLALQVLVKTNQAHEHWHIFEKMGHAFNYNHVDFAILQPLELDEIARTLKIIKKIRPKEKIDPEICGYIASVAKSSGVVYLPRDLFEAGCQGALDDLNNDLDLKIQVQDRWPSPAKEVDSFALKIQILRLQEIKSYA